MSEKPRLTAGERNTDAWRRLKAHYEARLADLTPKALNLGTPDTARRDLLVRIDEIQKFLAMGEPAPDKPTNAG
jgi:hypothetical protein